MLCSRPLCIYTEIWDSTAAYKNGLEHENEVFPKLKKKKKITFILCNFSVRMLRYFQIFFIFFCLWKHKKPPSKVAHNRPQSFFSQYWPGCPNQPRIDLSYYKYVPRLICVNSARNFLNLWVQNVYFWKYVSYRHLQPATPWLVIHIGLTWALQLHNTVLLLVQVQINCLLLAYHRVGTHYAQHPHVKTQDVHEYLVYCISKCKWL